MKKTILTALVMMVGVCFAFSALAQSLNVKAPTTATSPVTVSTPGVNTSTSNTIDKAAKETMKKAAEENGTFTYLKKDSTHAYFKDSNGKEVKLLLGENVTKEWPTNVKANDTVKLTYYPSINTLKNITK